MNICVASFSDIRFDARTKNIIEVLINEKHNVTLYSINNSQDCDYYNSLKQILNIFHNSNYFTATLIDIPQNRRILIQWISYINSIKSILLNSNFDLFWAADLYSLPCSKFFSQHIKIIYDSREIYSALSTLHHSPIKQKIISKIEKHFIKRTNSIITSGKLDSKYIKKHYELDTPIYEIFNYPKYKEHLNSSIIRDKFNISNGKTILIYQGMMLEGRGILPIMNALTKTDEFVLVLLGEGKFLPELIRNSKRLGIENKVYFAGNIEYSELHNWTCAADIGLCNIEPISFSYKLARPNKLFEYILAELPVLVTDLPALSEIVNVTKCGIIIPYNNNAKYILPALYELKNNNEYYKSNAKKNKSNFVYESQINVIKKIIGTK